MADIEEEVKEQKLAEELAQKANKQERPTKRPYVDS